jgi:hypothetical protein
MFDMVFRPFRCFIFTPIPRYFTVPDEGFLYLNIAHKQDCVSELLFWKSNILKLKPQSLLQKSSSYNLYTDASNSAAAGFIENFDLVMHKPWLPSEASKSSTW